MPESVDKITPMFEQYLGIKKDYPDALLFYRMGDFYELFYEDAEVASRELQIALTQRGKGMSAPMCGVPWHAAQSYIAQLIDKGFSVAICEQVEDPKAARGLVRREVSCVITPGTVLEDSNLAAKAHNFIGALYADHEKRKGALVWADISTGQWSGLEANSFSELLQWVRKLAVSELLLPQGLDVSGDIAREGTRLVYLPPISFNEKSAAERIVRAQNVRELGALGLDKKKNLTIAAGALLAYLSATQKRDPDHLLPFRPLDLSRHLVIDELTERNLEIFKRLNGRKGQGTLRHEIDLTMTPMGGRLLEDIVRSPWRDEAPIARMQEAVLFFHDNDAMRNAFRKALGNVYDLERLSTRINMNRCTPRDFISLRRSLSALPELKKIILAAAGEEPDTDDACACPCLFRKIAASWDDMSDCAEMLESAFVDEPPAQITDGGLFRQGYDSELDSYIETSEYAEQKLQKLLENEQSATGIGKLKLGYNRVFGYYYEISKNALPQTIPPHFIRKQTLANAERFTTEELQRLEENIIKAAENRKRREHELYVEIRKNIAGNRYRIVHMSAVIASLDYQQSLAEAGRRNGWCMPQISSEPEIHITGGRHPVVEGIIGKANFVPNDFHLTRDKRLCLITGPNMAGKSTVLRQVAIICLLAQIGSMVPASAAVIGLADRIFSRVGASDNLADGQSTFMVEMMETARILRQSTKNSLVILDEVGRGTSTFDGVALAWAVVEDLAGRGQKQLRTIFATHYHELIGLEGKIPGIFTMNVIIQEYKNEIVFLHRLMPGPADRSYGLEVARLAGIPQPVVQRAKNILKNLEQQRMDAGRQVLTAASIALPGIELSKNRSREAASGPHEKPAPPQELLQALALLDLDATNFAELKKIIAEWKNNWCS